MSLVDSAESWLAAHYDDLVAWRRHIHRYPELGRQEYATTQFVAERLADAGLNPKVLPGGTGLTCDFGPEHQPRIALRAERREGNAVQPAFSRRVSRSAAHRMRIMAMMTKSEEPAMKYQLPAAARTESME